MAAGSRRKGFPKDSANFSLYGRPEGVPIDRDPMITGGEEIILCLMNRTIFLEKRFL
jgi:hypothetical protein